MTAKKQAPSTRTCTAPQPLSCLRLVCEPLSRHHSGMRDQMRGEMSIKVALAVTASIVTTKKMTPITCFIGVFTHDSR